MPRLDPSRLGDPAEVFARLRRRPGAFFLDASLPVEGHLARSFLGADPVETLDLRAGRCVRLASGRSADAGADPFAAIEDFAREGGFLAGFLTYDLGRSIEGTPAHARDDSPLPLLRFARYRSVLEHDPASGWSVRGDPALLPPLDGAEAAGEGPAWSLGPWTPSVAREDYLRAVERAKALIREGEIYQANLSHRFTAPFAGDPWGMYLALRKDHPVPYGAYLPLPEGTVLSLSPECFLQVAGDEVLTVPIKGTVPRSGDAAADARERSRLEASAKDRAELAMIVDLERNDLGRVCRPGTVRVEETRRIEPYATVHHAAARVRGRLREGVGIATLLRAAFPGGSVTGCPKIRAMQALAELEPYARGLYTGSIGWIDGKEACLSIVIRTVVVAADRAVLNVGGGIVADSDPSLEHEETLHKGRAFLSTGPAGRLGGAIIPP